MMSDPYAPQFDQINKHIDCLANRIDQNALEISKLKSRLTAVENFAKMTSYEQKLIREKVFWKEGRAAKKLITKIQQLHSRATDCFYCLVGTQLPALQAKLAPKFGQTWENGRPLSRPGGLQCDVNNVQCDSTAFLRHWINDVKWQEILQDLVELLMFTKYNWQIAQTSTYRFCRRFHCTNVKDYKIVGPDAKSMALVVKSIP